MHIIAAIFFLLAHSVDVVAFTFLFSLLNGVLTLSCLLRGDDMLLLAILQQEMLFHLISAKIFASCM